ncbi:MAG: esterase family protein [Flavobacteriaceae bacterium]|nr:esterase family protein [Flavobacteriaceae bacterium]
MKKTFLLLLISTSIFAQNVDTLTVFSNSMQKNIKNIIIVPDSFQGQNKNFPVLYLLHGATGDFTNWITKVPQIKTYANQYQMIIVCPDGDPFSWYFDSPVDKKYRYETYISKELISEIDKKYPTIKSKKGRAITGLSMGGHGAFYLAFKHQDLFGSVGSMSGGMNYIPLAHKENYELTKRLGDYDLHPKNWKNNTIINMTDLVVDKDLKIYFDCGINDFLFNSNKELHEKMLKQNIPHDYTERPGGHSWDYWSNSLKYHMVFFNTYFESKD